MKKITQLFLFLLLFSFFIPISYSQTIIHTEDFEGADFNGYAIGNGDTGTDYPSQIFVTSVADRIGRGLVGDFTFAGIVTGNTTNVIGGEDIDFTTDGGFYNGHSYIELDPVNISGKTNLSIDIDLAFPNTIAGRYEINDFLIVDYRIDGGAYTTALAFYGDNTGSGSPTLGLRRDVNLNGTLEGSETTNVNTAMTNFILNLDAITDGTVSGVSIEIRVRFNMPDSHEEFAFDNIILKGIDAPCTNPTVPTITASANPVCASSTTTLNIAGTLNDATQWAIYTGSCGGTLVGTTASTSFVVTPAGPSTTYYVRGEGGCITPGSCGSLTVNVTTVSLTAASQTNISCNAGSNGAASVNSATGGTGSYTYNWTPGNPTGDGTVSVTGLTAGTWTCTVTDANSCTATQTFTITQPSALLVNVVVNNNVSCNGLADGSATVSATGGTTSYTYLWSNGATTASITGLTAGDYTQWTTDANGCEVTTFFTITEPAAINNTISEITSGILTSNEISAISYQWYQCPSTLLIGENNQNFEPTALGDYKVEITVNSCVVESACYTVTTLDIESFENVTKFIIYPNPANGLLNINSSFDGDFVIVNQLGQIVHSFKVNSNVENTINVDNLADGIYFIKGINGTKISSQKLIIKK